jgi:hypothetical protein
MKKLLVLLLLWAGTSFAQSPFEDTWITNRDRVQLRDKQTEYLGGKGMMQCVGCTEHRNQRRWASAENYGCQSLVHGGNSDLVCKFASWGTGVLRFLWCSGAGRKVLRCFGKSRQPAFYFVLILDTGNC